MKPGFFISFEGIEGCGKTTQMGLLDRALRERGRVTLLTREPGGTPIGDAVRRILLQPEFTAMKPMTELLLYAAGRHQHVEEVLRPALAEGKTILCDRYADSSTAYQGAARKLKPPVLDKIHRLATGNFWPDLTLVLDLPVETALRRIEGRALDRFEKENIAFHKRVRLGYQALARHEPRRVRLIPAEGEKEAVHQDILKIVLERIGR